MAELQRGVVKWFNDAKGYGFITHETGRDIFVHFSVIEQEGFKTLKDGEEVQYELREGDKGLNASRVVRLLSEAELAAAKAAAEQSSAPAERTSAPTTSVSNMIEVEREGSQSSEQVLISDAAHAERSLANAAEK
ncbi:MAG: cold shock domain-containing protein [Bdellovibrionales bacterium]|nr:cold shock domain-containing protein [Bdellovibrionales bacterium]